MRFRFVRRFAAYFALLAGLLPAQYRQDPGHSIGTVKTQDNLVVLTLNEGALGKEHLFDLDYRTLRFTPESNGYRVENIPVKWDAEFGPEMTVPQATLKSFAFPFSGKTWNSFTVGATGAIGFGGAVTIGRFDQLQEAARTLVNSAANANPALCVFLKPRMSGHRYMKELADSAVVTWDVTEPYGNIQDFTWVPTVNRFQAVLHRGGAIDMSYDKLTARDAIVGVYPAVPGGEERSLGTLKGNGTLTDGTLKSVKLTAAGIFLKATFEMAAPIVPASDPKANGVQFRLSFSSKPEIVWTVRGISRGGRGGARYIASGPGVAAGVQVEGNTLTMQGTVPDQLNGATSATVSAEVVSLDTAAKPAIRIGPQPIALTGLRSPAVHFAALKRGDGPFSVAYESFHYVSLPNPRDLTCSVIQALGDKFDMLAYYSAFRVDNQEAGTPSNGPLGAIGGAVTGIGANQRGLESYCSAGRFQWQFIQPVYSGSNQMQERPPAGITSTNTHDVMTYDKQLGERWLDGKMPPYNYAMSQIGHEMGHRWGAFVSAKVNGETIPLGPTHWARGLQAPVAFPYQRPVEASAMGGGVWQDNFDGTFTQLDDDYYVPATGWSYLDLYLMGMIGPSEVPDFFILRNLVAMGRDANGHGIFKADRVKVTVQDVIAVEGPRVPSVEQAQKKFNTGMVVVVEHGKTPSRELIDRTKGIAERWIDYWATTTGQRSSMTTSAR